jgi:TetR/AcrR family transcriptional repressor of nem operon
MRVSREQAEENRAAIVAAASRLFREQGFDISIAAVCHAAGLTHGGFYGQFGSKDALEAESCAAVFEDKIAELDEDISIVATLSRYLTSAHRDRPGVGCPMAALAASVPRRDAAVQEEFAAGVDRYVDGLAAKLGEVEDRRGLAMLTLSAMVGALILARASASRPGLSDEILGTVRRELDALLPAGAASA